MRYSGRFIEKALAVASFAVATAFAFLSLAISPTHEVAANNMILCAQFLTFSATLLGIDYKFSRNDL